jgi:hypothetical protein
MKERRRKTINLASTTRKIMNVGRWPELLAQEKKTKQNKEEEEEDDDDVEEME